jgi:hypothetical protein
LISLYVSDVAVRILRVLEEENIHSARIITSTIQLGRGPLLRIGCHDV